MGHPHAARLVGVAVAEFGQAVRKGHLVRLLDIVEGILSIPEREHFVRIHDFVRVGQMHVHDMESVANQPIKEGYPLQSPYEQAGFLIGLMYFGYSVGLVASLSLAPLMRVFKTPTRLILFASAVYVASCLTLAVPSLWALFGGLWLIAFGEFVVHSISPGLINHQAMLSGHGDRGMVNGLFLSCYYFGGLLGSYIPGALYSGFGWLPATSVFNSVQVAAFFVLFRLHRTAPDLR